VVRLFANCYTLLYFFYLLPQTASGSNQTFCHSSLLRTDRWAKRMFCTISAPLAMLIESDALIINAARIFFIMRSAARRQTHAVSPHETPVRRVILELRLGGGSTLRVSAFHGSRSCTRVPGGGRRRQVDAVRPLEVQHAATGRAGG